MKENFDMYTEKDASWDGLTYEEKNRRLYEEQKALHETFLEKGTISKAQYDKSLTDLTLKMGKISSSL